MGRDDGSFDEIELTVEVERSDIYIGSRRSDPTERGGAPIETAVSEVNRLSIESIDRRRRWRAWCERARRLHLRPEATQNVALSSASAAVNNVRTASRSGRKRTDVTSMASIGMSSRTRVVCLMAPWLGTSMTVGSRCNVSVRATDAL